MMQSRTLRRLVFATLLAIAVTLLPAAPASAISMDGWAFHSAPAAWSLLWNFVARVWDKAGAQQETGTTAVKGSVPNDPQTSPIQIGADIDPHG